MTNATENPSPEEFESALEELETLVQSLEQGELGLEESLARFERGIKLARSCQTSLTRAEQRVQALLEQAGEQRLQDLPPTTPAADEPGA